MKEQSERREHTFVVRLWVEAAGDFPATLRGSVEHVGSSRRLYFSSLADLNDFIALRLSAKVEAS